MPPIQPCAIEQSPLLRDPVKQDKDNLRQTLVDEALSWVGTPFHHEARVKKAGVDCGQLLLECFEAVGLIPHIVVNHYPPDFACHRDDEWYLRIIGEYCTEIQGPPLPGDVIIFKCGRLFSHGGLVISWPVIIHASTSMACVGYGNALLRPLSAKPRRIFRHRALWD